MAILTEAQLRATREAAEAGVSNVLPADATAAIERAQATLNRCLGYKVEDADTTHTFIAQDADTLTVRDKRIRTISAITDAFPGGTAASLGTTDWAIRGNGFRLYRIGGWRQDNTVVITGTFGYATTDDQYILAKQFVTRLAVRDLVNTGPGIGGMAVPPGSLVTSLTTASGAEAGYFTPSGDSTGYDDLDKLLVQIGKHPSKGSSGIYTIGLTTGMRDLTFDDILAGRETTEHL